MPANSEKPRRTPGEIQAQIKAAKERLAREGHTNLAWWDDPELGLLTIELFSCYRHRWLKKKPTSKIVHALCTGFEHRGGLPDEVDRPPCAGCERKWKGDWS